MDLTADTASKETVANAMRTVNTQNLGLIRLRELEAALLNRRDELADAEKKVNEMLTLM